jgi:uncharacterized repeat protein (TIGR01451 family)
MKKAFIVSAFLNFFQRSKERQVSKRLASGILGLSALTMILLVAGCGSSAPPPVAPTITTQPTPVSMGVGGTVTFTAAASGTPTPTVQWMVSTGGAFTAVAGATSTTLSFTATAGQNGNTFEAVFTNSAGSATTNAVALTIVPAPVITTNPVNVSVNAGATATFTAAATGSPAPTVQWQVSTNGTTFTNVAGATSTTLSFATTASQNGNLFKAVFTNTGGSTSTTAATLTVLAPALSIQKSHTGSFTAGTNGVFTIAVSNSGNTATTAPITVTDTLAASLTFVSGTGTNWVCAAVAQAVTCTNPGPIAAAGAAGNITLTTAVAANAPASVQNTAVAATTGSANASSTDTVTVVAAPAPDLSITKTASGTFTPGANAAYQIAVSNIGSASTTGTITVTDTLNAAFTFVSGTGTSWTCANALQVVTCTNPGPVANGSVAGNITLTVAVSNTASGSIDNTATVSDTGDTTDVADKSSKATVTIGAAALCANAPTGNESMLHGQYAFRLQGWQGSGSGQPIAMAGSFNADGTGKIGSLTGGIGGDLDINNENPGPQHLTISPSGSTTSSIYKVGPDGTSSGFLGCVVLTTNVGNTTSNVTFTFSLNAAVAGVSSKGRIIEFDDTTGSGNRAAGELMLQDTTAFSAGNTSALHANYAFGGSGQSAAGRFAIAGSFTFNATTGALSAVNFDSDSAGVVVTVGGGTTGGTLSPASVSAVDGRATLSINASLLTGTSPPASAIVYIVNANEMFLVGADPFAGHAPIYSGKTIASAASYTSAAIAGNLMFHVTGQNSCTVGSQQVPCASVGIGALTATASTSTTGTLTGDIFNFDQTNGASITNLPSGSPGTFTLTAANGRVVLSNTGGGHSPVLYLATPQTNTEPITAFLVGTDNSTIFGTSEAGASAAITTSSLAGKYFVGSDEPGDNTVKTRVEVVTLLANGTFTGTGNTSGSTGLQFLRADSGTIAITNTPDLGVGNAGTQSVVITNGKRILVIDESGSATAVLIIELQ